VNELDRSTEAALREEIAQVCHLLYQKNMIPATDGNVSARWGEEWLITTPSGVPKGIIAPDDWWCATWQVSSRGSRCARARAQSL
jgi:ribulose-5-phosphate 4-epimerase/fuculose-1-phosphate aldolase